MNTFDREYCNKDKCTYMTLNNNDVLDKIKVELIQSIQNGVIKIESGNEELFHIIDKYRKEITMVDVETLIIEAAHKRDLTYAKDFNGRAYALMDADWIGYFDTLDEVLEFLGISVKIDESRK